MSAVCLILLIFTDFILLHINYLFYRNMREDSCQRRKCTFKRINARNMNYLRLITFSALNYFTLTL